MEHGYGPAEESHGLLRFVGVGLNIHRPRSRAHIICSWLGEPVGKNRLTETRDAACSIAVVKAAAQKKYICLISFITY